MNRSAVVAGTDPNVVVRVTHGGRALFQLFYGCPGRASRALCYVGSWDFLHWEASGVPILQPDPPAETGPSAIVSMDAAVLFFAQTPTGMRSRIGVAIAP